MKMKYRTNNEFEAPLFRNICEFENSGMMYGANGSFSKQKSKMTTEYTKNGKRSIEDDSVDDSFDNNFFPDLTAEKHSNLFNDQETNEDEADAYHCTRMGKMNKNDVYNGDRYVRCRERTKYIDHSYVPNGSMVSGGFGALDRFSELKQGMGTRDKHDTVSDMPIDDYRFHYTFRNYQDAHLGSNPFPENTRYANKKYIN
jgi:hypothetical protein